MGKLKEIENRYYKECNVVMLSTKDIIDLPANIPLLIGKLHYVNNAIYKVLIDHTLQKQHLYITSDDEIKEKDWYLYLDNNTKEYLFDQEKGAFENHNWTCNKLNRFTLIGKIIATTDDSLILEKLGTARFGDHDYIYNLPQPSQSFIKKFCELGGINEVLVEYEKNGLKCYKCGKNEEHCINTSKNCLGYFESKYKLKTDSHNTITIKPVKDSWSREEVINLITNYANDFSILDTKINKNHFNNWIKENL